MVKNNNKNTIAIVIFFGILAAIIIVGLSQKNLIDGFVRTDYKVVNVSVPGYSEEEIQKEILLGNKSEIESKKVYNVKNIKISSSNFVLPTNQKILGKNLEIDIGGVYNIGYDYFIHVENKETIDTLMNLERYEFLELEFKRKGQNIHDKNHIYYTIKSEGEFFSKEMYKFKDMFYITATLLLAVIIIVVGMISLDRR